MATIWPPPWRRYGLAAAATLIAAVVKEALGPEILPGTYGAFAPAVLISAWYGGLGPGLFCALLSAVTASFLIEGASAFDAGVVARTALWITGSGLASWFLDRRAVGEARVAESEERLRRVLESDIIGIFFWERAGRIVEANDEFLRMVGYSREDLRAGRLEWSELTPPEYAPLDQRALAEIDATGTWTPFEKEYICRDGRRVPVLLAGAATANGRDRGVSFVLEITERKQIERDLREAKGDLESRVAQRTAELSEANERMERELSERLRAESALREREERSRRISALASDYTYAFRVEADGRTEFEWTAGAFERITGFTPREVGGLSGIVELAHPDDLGVMMERMARLLAGEAAVVEYRIRTKWGTYRWVQDSARPEWDGSQTGTLRVLGAARDITERREAEEALRASEERFALAVAGANDGIWDWNLTTNEVYFSPRWKEMLGLADDEIGSSPEEWIGRVHPDDEARVRADVADHLEGRTPLFRSEYRLRHHDGTYLWALVRAVAVRDADGKAHRMAGSLTDLSQRKRAEEEARRRQGELAHAQRLSTMGEMAAGLAHELNQPLAAIVSYARGCERRIESGDVQSEELVHAIDQVAKQALRAGEIIRRYRGFVRTGNDRRAPVDLNALAQEVARFVKPSADEERVALRLDLDPKLPQILADGLQIEQVLLNLIRNGLDAIQGADARELVVTTRAVEEGVEVAVRDTGHGFAEDIRERIFDAFFTTKPQGLGMGLSISRSIIDAHGGRLSSTTSEADGTTFRFTLPLGSADD